MKTKLSFVAILALCAAPLAYSAAPAAGTPGPAGWEASSRLPQAIASPLPGDGMQVTVHHLANGLTVYLSPNHEVPRIAAWIAVRAGSRQDPSSLTGMAHYLEHMFFKGSTHLGTLNYDKEKPRLETIQSLYEQHFTTTDTVKRQEIYGLIDKENIEAGRYAVPNELDKAYKTLGFRGVNAFTSNEMTVYVNDLPKNRVEAWAKLESDRFNEPVFRLFQTEIETVYEEKNRSSDNPGRILGEALDKTLYQDHPYGRTTLGSIEHLKNPSLARLYAFQRNYYVPNNMAIALAGDFDRGEMLKVLERYFGTWRPKVVAPAEEFAVPKPTVPLRVEVKYESEEQVVIAWPLPPYGDPDRDALTLMDMVMDNSESGIVNLTLNQAQKVKKAGSGPEFLNEAGVWQLWAVPKDSQTLEQAEALLMETVAKLKAGDFSDEDLKAIVTNYEIREKEKLESNNARVSEMAESYVHYEEWAHAADWIERVKKLTKDDVLRVARRYLGEGKVVAYRRRGKPEIPSIQKPGFTKVELAPGRESKFFRELVSLPAKPIEPRWLAEGQDYRTVKTPWGELVAAKNPFNDLFTLTLGFERGFRHERELCEALDLLNLSGGGDMTADAFKKRLYALGTTMRTGCDEQESSVHLSGLEKNLEESVRLMRLRFEAPNVATDTLKKMIEVGIGAHKDNKVNPNYIGYALGEWAERGAESTVLAELSDAQLRALDEARLKGLLKSFFGVLHRAGYVGTLPDSEVVRLLTVPGKAYAPAPERKPLRLRRPNKEETIFVHRDMVQSQVGMFAADEVYDPAKAVDYIFYSDFMGGGMSSVIFQEVREARALAYAASGGYSPGSRKGDENRLWGHLGTQADKTIEATTLMKGLLTKLPSSADRFRETKQSIEERYRTMPIEFRGVPGAILGWEDQGFDKDPRPERFKKSLGYTLTDLERFARRFESEPKTVFILGNRGRVDLEGLKKLGGFSEKPLDELFPY
ncbi:MAG: insulinase family protein [Elusimicrobia bacterium]|nr:insulinase family protein [Elusimicrobiota bacterium]